MLVVVTRVIFVLCNIPVTQVNGGLHINLVLHFFLRLKVEKIERSFWNTENYNRPCPLHQISGGELQGCDDGLNPSSEHCSEHTRVWHM